MTVRRYAAEFVFPGHPDKLGDAVADALVAEAGRRERRALCGVEVAVHRHSVFVTGRIACQDAETIDVEAIVREVYRSAGYDAAWEPAPADLRIETDLCLGPLEAGEAEFRRISDDQSIVIGYAAAIPGTNYLPPEQWLAQRIGRRLRQLRTEQPSLRLGPDGKVFITLTAENGNLRLSGLSTSLQQRVDGPEIELQRAVWALLKEELRAAAERIPGFVADPPANITVNGAGNFSVGGPEGDNGLSGKKLVVDYYGPRVPIGGGAISGKDFFKPDRAGAILARRLAKAVVLTGVATECTATLGFAPGAEQATVLELATPTGTLDPRGWETLFDLSLIGTGERYTNRSDLVEVARYGHFTDPRLPWEQLTFDAETETAAAGPAVALSSTDEYGNSGPPAKRQRSGGAVFPRSGILSQ